MSWIPTDYELPKTQGGNYFKPEAGVTKIRIMTPPIMGYETWIDAEQGTRKPLRYRLNEKVTAGEDKKFFWAVVIWNYNTNSVQIWQINQRTIQEQLLSYNNAPSWGDPTKYDLQISKSGQKLETKYNIIPLPPTALTEQQQQTFLEANVVMDKLFEGENPFGE